MSPSEPGLWPILAVLTPPPLPKANSTKVQEDLEAEFQSLFSLLEELKEGMLMKIKQDRASRTYELQVGRAGGRSGPSPRPYPPPTAPLRLSRARLASGSPSTPAAPPTPPLGGAPECLPDPEQTPQWPWPHLLCFLASSLPLPWP